MPLYPLLAQATGALLGDGVLGGRLVSALAGAALAVVVFRLGETLFGARAAWVGTALYTVSPLPFRWSVRAMTDVPFALALTAGLWLMVEGLRRPGPGRVGLAIFVLGLGALIRPEGVLGVVPALALAIFTGWRRGPKVAVLAGWGWASWVAFALWRWALTTGAAGYAETANHTLDRLQLANLGTFTSFYGSYFFMAVFSLTPIVIAFAYVGFQRLKAGPRAALPAAATPSTDSGETVWEPAERWLLVGTVTFLVVATAGIVSVHFFFSTRHLLFLYPLACVLAGGGLAPALARSRWRQLLLGVAMLNSVLLLGAAMIGAQETFGDLRRGAELARGDGYTGPILATDFEQKVSRTFAGEPVGRYVRAKAAPGQRVLLNNFEFGDKGQAAEQKWLCATFVCRTVAQTGARTMPILADDLGADRTVNGNVRHNLGHLFRWHQFETVVIELGPRQRPAATRRRRGLPPPRE